MEIIKIDTEKAHFAPKIFQQIETPEGHADTIKVLCALIKMFSEMIKVKRGLMNHEIIWCADWIMRNCSHDSIEDIALALKSAIYGEHNFYGTLTVKDICSIISHYIDQKLKALEAKHQAYKNEPSIPLVAEATKLLLAKNQDDLIDITSQLKAWEKQQKIEKASKVWKEHQDNLEDIRKRNAYFAAIEERIRSEQDSEHQIGNEPSEDT